MSTCITAFVYNTKIEWKICCCLHSHVLTSLLISLFRTGLHCDFSLQKLNFLENGSLIKSWLWQADDTSEQSKKMFFSNLRVRNSLSKFKNETHYKAQVQKVSDNKVLHHQTLSKFAIFNFLTVTFVCGYNRSKNSFRTRCRIFCQSWVRLLLPRKVEGGKELGIPIGIWTPQ